MSTTSVQYTCNTCEFLGFYGKSRLFTLLSHGKQVDATEEEDLHRETPRHLQAQRGFLTSGLNGVRTCSDTAAENQLIRRKCL